MREGKKARHSINCPFLGWCALAGVAWSRWHLSHARCQEIYLSELFQVMMSVGQFMDLNARTGSTPGLPLTPSYNLWLILDFPRVSVNNTKQHVIGEVLAKGNTKRKCHHLLILIHESPKAIHLPTINEIYSSRLSYRNWWHLCSIHKSMNPRTINEKGLTCFVLTIKSFFTHSFSVHLACQGRLCDWEAVLIEQFSNPFS